MKSKWILTLTAAAVGMSMMLAGCGGKDTASDGSSTHSNPSSHAEPLPRLRKRKAWEPCRESATICRTLRPPADWAI